MIKGVIINELKKYDDERGWLAEFYREDEVETRPVMGYISETKPGVARGPHEHREQTDLFIFAGPGKFRLFLWDNRNDSPTFSETFSDEYGAGRPTTVIIPPGVVHGYKCISDLPGQVVNLADKLWRGQGKKEEVDEIRHEKDPDSPFKID